MVAKDPVIDGQTSLGWAVDQQGLVRGYYAVKGLNYYLYHRNDADSDFKLLEKEWTRLVVRSIKNFKGVPDTEDRKKLSLNKRINYFIS